MKKITLVAVIALFSFTLFAQEEVLETLSPGLYANVITTKGTLVYQLDYENAPLTVLSFAMLVNGSLNENEDGSSYLIDREFNHSITNYAIFMDYRNPSDSLKFFKESSSFATHADVGTLSMLGNMNNTYANQIFIMKSADEHLDSLYTPFGRLIDGESTVLKLKEGDSIVSVEFFTEGLEVESFQLTMENYQLLFDQSRALEMETFRTQHPDVAAIIDGFDGNYSKSDTGIFYQVKTPGTGEEIVRGDSVRVHYEGSLTNGQVFDSSYDRGEPFILKVGIDQVIPGWVESLLDMEVGETRVVIIPPELAYGAQGAGGIIPPNAYLVFKIEVVGKM